MTTFEAYHRYFIYGQGSHFVALLRFLSAELELLKEEDAITLWCVVYTRSVSSFSARRNTTSRFLVVRASTDRIQSFALLTFACACCAYSLVTVAYLPANAYKQTNNRPKLVFTLRRRRRRQQHNSAL